MRGGSAVIIAEFHWTHDYFENSFFGSQAPFLRRRLGFPVVVRGGESALWEHLFFRVCGLFLREFPPAWSVFSDLPHGPEKMRVFY